MTFDTYDNYRVQGYLPSSRTCRTYPSDLPSRLTQVAGAHERLDWKDHHDPVALRYVISFRQDDARHLPSCDAVVFDGLMIVLAMLSLNIFHPALLLGKADTWLSRDSDEGIKTMGSSKESV